MLSLSRKNRLVKTGKKLDFFEILFFLIKLNVVLYIEVRVSLGEKKKTFPDPMKR